MNVERTHDEAPLVQRAQKGDVAAFEVLYRRSVDQIYTLCLRLTADAALADELCQSTFVAAWSKLPSFAGTSAITSWLHRIAVNETRMHHRSQGRYTKNVLSMTPEPPSPSATGARIDLEKAIATLPDGARAVFVLHDVEGYRHAEVADTLGVSVGTSKAQLHRARRLLRKELNHVL